MRPLAGIRVIDLTHALAGPFCTYHLGLLGADIVKVEPPGHGDDFRAFAPEIFRAVNGGKRSVALDLKQAEDRAAFDRLVDDADILIENFRPDASRRLGLDWAALHARNPRLIFCSISGFGTGDARETWPAVEWSVQAASGLAASYLDEDGDPRDLGLGVLDVYTGTSAVTAILAALLERARTGMGVRLEVTMADAALALASPGLERQLAATPAPRQRRPAVGRFRARDRRLFVMAPHDRWFGAFAEVLGAPLLTDDARFATGAARAEHADALLVEIEARLATRDAADWQSALLARGVPAAAVATLAEFAGTGYFTAAGTVHVQVDADGARYPVAGATLFGRATRDAPRPVPALDADHAAVLGQPAP